MLRVIEINESATEIKDPSPELNDDNSIEKSRSSKWKQSFYNLKKQQILYIHS